MTGGFMKVRSGKLPFVTQQIATLTLNLVLIHAAQGASFIGTGLANHGRSSETATLLPNGQVLAAGGTSGASSSSAADLYNPLTGLWSPITGMSTNRRSHTATI